MRPARAGQPHRLEDPAPPGPRTSTPLYLVEGLRGTAAHRVELGTQLPFGFLHGQPFALRFVRGVFAVGVHLI